MRLSATDGTQKTIEDLRKAKNILQECYLRIQEINNGNYSIKNPPIQFDYCTCPELSNCVDNINDITQKIEKVVYQEH